MNRQLARRQLARDGWLQLALVMVPLLLANRIPAFSDQLGLVLFGAGLASLFLSLPRFTAYKHALIATEKSFGTADEDRAWATLRHMRRRALMVASLPAWLAAVGAPLGLEPVAQLLLMFGTLVLLLLYRTPRQLQ